MRSFCKDIRNQKLPDLSICSPRKWLRMRSRKYVDRTLRNPCDIEHIWADNYAYHDGECSSQQDFDEWRDHVGGLVLLPADVNRSYQDKPFKEKAPHYAKQNFFAASLTGAEYQHQPQFQAFVTENGFPFRAYDRFDKEQQHERRRSRACAGE
jgi:hypothetical protein